MAPMTYCLDMVHVVLQFMSRNAEKVMARLVANIIKFLQIVK